MMQRPQMIRRESRLSRFVLVLALALGAIPALAGGAAADDFAPTITSFGRTSVSPIGGNELVTITFDAYDDGPAGLGYAMFTFATPLGGQFRVDSEWMSRAASGTFVATKSIGPWGASGTYTLAKVEIHDREGNMTTYERATAPQFDFAAADFEVDNPNEDTEAPTIRSASLFQTTVLQGTPVVVLYDAQDNLSGVKSVTFSGWSPTGGNYWIESLPELAAVGPAAWIVPLEAASGDYESFVILVRDRAGNELLYRPEARYTYPPEASIPEHNSPDIASLNFTVVGRTGDRVSPTMTELSMLTSADRRLGEDVALHFTASDQGVGIEQIAAQWVDNKGHAIDAARYCGERNNGHIATEIEDFRTVGSDWQLRVISFADYLGNQTSYMRDGRVLYQNGDPGPPTHSFDMSLGDFHIGEGSARSNEYENTSFLRCPKIGTVVLGVDDPSTLVGETVTAIGDVLLGEIPIEDPIVAIHEYIDGVAALIGVVQGDAAGHFEDTFVAEAMGTLQATFLGTDGPMGLDQLKSNLVELVVASRVNASLSDITIRLGDRATITGFVEPAEGGSGSVVLQRRFPGGWRERGSKQVDSEGAFRFTIRPQKIRTYRYRILRPGWDSIAPAKSRVLTLTVERGPR